MIFDQAFDELIGNEGGYSFNSVDPGGETMWGITAKVARANGFRGDMKFLPREAADGVVSAKSIARAAYWDTVRADELPDVLRFQVFDAAYNSGPPQAVKWVQRAVDVDDDGAIGPATLAAVAASNRIFTAILLDVERLEFLAERPTWPAFGRGWARRIAKNLRTLVAELRKESA